MLQPRHSEMPNVPRIGPCKPTTIILESRLHAFLLEYYPSIPSPITQAHASRLTIVLDISSWFLLFLIVEFYKTTLHSENSSASPYAQAE